MIHDHLKAVNFFCAKTLSRTFKELDKKEIESALAR